MRLPVHQPAPGALGVDWATGKARRRKLGGSALAPPSLQAPPAASGFARSQKLGSAQPPAAKASGGGSALPILGRTTGFARRQIRRSPAPVQERAPEAPEAGPRFPGFARPASDWRPR